MITLNIDLVIQAFDLAQKARSVFGDVGQDNMITEECGELITAIARRERGRGTEAEVDEEAADVFLVVLGAMNPDAWRVLARKVERLRGILNNANG